MAGSSSSSMGGMRKKEIYYVIRVLYLTDYRMFTRRFWVRTVNSRLFHDFRPYQEDPRWPGWQVVIGIETHAQIKSRRKLFSGTNHLNFFFFFLINSTLQILRRQLLRFLRIFTYHPLTQLFLEHSPCVLQHMILGIWGKKSLDKLENQCKMCRPSNSNCIGVEMSDIFPLIF